MAPRERNNQHELEVGMAAEMGYIPVMKTGGPPAAAWLVAALLSVLLTFRLPAAEPEICPVHRVPMQPAELKLVYGLPSPDEFKEMEVARNKFPFGKDYVLAGCVVQPAKTVKGFLCPACVQARTKWLKTHASKRDK